MPKRFGIRKLNRFDLVTFRIARLMRGQQLIGKSSMDETINQAIVIPPGVFNIYQQ